jgi:integrase
MKFRYITTSGDDLVITLHQRQSGGPWHYYFRKRGKRFRDSTKTTVQAAARRVAEHAANTSTPAPQQAATLGELAQAYLDSRWPEDQRSNNDTYSDHKGRLIGSAKSPSGFVEHAGPSLVLAALTADEVKGKVQAYFDLRARDCAGRTVTNDRLVIGRFLKWAMQRYGLPWAYNPAYHTTIEIPPLKESDPQPLSDTDIAALLPAARKSDVWPVVVLCLGAGLRPREACRVKWSDVLWEQHSARVLNLKGRRQHERTVILCDWAEGELKAWQDAHKASQKPFPYNHDTGFDLLADVRESAKLPAHVTLQALRQTACTRAIQGGMDLADYVMQFGHSLETAQRHYLKLGRAIARRQALNSLDFGKFCPQICPHGKGKNHVSTDSQKTSP